MIQQKAASESICYQLKKMDLDKCIVHVFFPIKKLNEIDLGIFIDHCHSTGINLCTSVSNFSTNTMRTVLINKNTPFHTNDWGIPEPKDGPELDESEIDIVIVPLLYADRKGNRIGYGKGFYDRFLANCKSSVNKIGVNYFPSSEDLENIDSTDIRLNQLLIAEY